MKRFFAALRASCGRMGGRWLLSAGLTLLFFALFYACNTPAYLNVDDSNIAKALSGALSGTPEPHPFINCLLGKAMCFLYGLLPRVPWWPASEIFMLALSGTALCASLLKSAERRGLSLLWPLALYALFSAMLLSYAMQHLSFTLTAGALGASSVAVLTAAEFASFETERRTRARSVLLSLLLLALAFLYRNSAGVSILPFWALALCWKMADLRAKGAGSRTAYRRVLCCGLAAAALSCVMMVVNAWGLDFYNEAGFTRFDTARSDFIDYPVDSYAGNAALYEGAGWDAPLAALVPRWFFMDERVTAEALERIAAGSAVQSRPFAQKCADALAAGERFLRENGTAQYTFMLPAALLCFCIASFFHGDAERRRRGAFALSAAVCCALGAFALCFYLCYAGRFILRTYLLLCLPATALLAALLTALLPAARTEEKPRYGRRGTMTVLFGVLFMPVAWGLVRLSAQLAAYDPAPAFAESRALYAYAKAHPHNLYIRDTEAGKDIEPFLCYADELPQNLISWGDTDMYTAARAAQEHALGLRAFTPALFLENGVYYVTSTRSDNAALFADYLRARSGAALVKVDEPGFALAVWHAEAAKE